MAQEIWIDIDDKGNVTVEGKGFEGADCEAATRELEAAVGDVEKRMKKPEYFRRKAAVKTHGR